MPSSPSPESALRLCRDAEILVADLRSRQTPDNWSDARATHVLNMDLLIDSGVSVDLGLWESPDFQRNLSVVSVPLVVAEATERTMQQDLAKALDVETWGMSWNELLDRARETLAEYRTMDRRLGRFGKEPPQ